MKKRRKTEVYPRFTKYGISGKSGRERSAFLILFPYSAIPSSNTILLQSAAKGPGRTVSRFKPK